MRYLDRLHCAEGPQTEGAWRAFEKAAKAK